MHGFAGIITGTSKQTESKQRTGCRNNRKIHQRDYRQEKKTKKEKRITR